MLAGCHAFTDARGAEHKAKVVRGDTFALADDAWLDAMADEFGGAAVLELGAAVIQLSEARKAALALSARCLVSCSRAEHGPGALRLSGKRRDADREVLDATAHAVVADFADDLAREWGCPAAGHRPPAQLPKHLAAEARITARVVGLDEVPTTALRVRRRRRPWVVEITRAAGIAHDYHTPSRRCCNARSNRGTWQRSTRCALDSTTHGHPTERSRTQAQVALVVVEIVTSDDAGAETIAAQWAQEIRHRVAAHGVETGAAVAVPRRHDAHPERCPAGRRGDDA